MNGTAERGPHEGIAVHCLMGQEGITHAITGYPAITPVVQPCVVTPEVAAACGSIVIIPRVRGCHYGKLICIFYDVIVVDVIVV